MAVVRKHLNKKHAKTGHENHDMQNVFANTLVVV